MIGVLDVPAAGTVDDLEERGLVFPVPGEGKNTVLLEPRDGSSIQPLNATALTFKVGDRTMLSVRKVRVDLFITDARLALACSRYDKGGGWVGGATGMIVFNSVSKARAALRSRGKVLAGQIRYPWLQWVVSSPKTGWTSEETLVMQCASEDGTNLRLTLTLPKNIEAARVAAEIADRAARYRLMSEELDAEARAGIEPHLGSQSRIVASSEKQVFEMVAARPVNEHSARLAPSAGAVAPELPTAGAFCTACGEGISSDDAFCSACGEKAAT